MDDWKGSFELVDPNLIIIDHRYQRKEKPGLIATIASNPDWAAFGAVSLFRRKNGVLVCVDGQQRLRGVMASERPPRRIPAIIHEVATVAEEARTFVAMNVIRKVVDVMEKHEAMVVAKNPTALAIERAVEKAGYNLSAKTTKEWRTINAIGSVYWVYDQLGEEGLTQVLVLARDAWPDDPAGTSVHILRGICDVLIDQGAEYNRAKVTTAFARSSPHIIERKADELRFDIGGSKQKNIRRAIKALCKI